jgi:ABC-type glycerol-3-phosphate transport system substrate-binding protein
MRALALAFLVLYASAIPSSGQSAATELYYNGKALGRTITQASSVGELFGPQFEAWKLEAGGRVIQDDLLGERLYELQVQSGRTGWELLLQASDGRPAERVPLGSRLALYGEACSERDLEVWISWEGVPELKAEILAWANAAGINAKVLDVPSVKSKLIAVQRGGGKIPDLVMIQSDYVSDLRDAASLQELDSLKLPTGAAKGKDAYTLDGRLYAAPFYCDAQLVFYSTRLIKAAPPEGWTLADMERLAMDSGASVPAAWNAYSSYWFLPFATGFGAAPFARGSGSADFDSPGWLKALTWMRGASQRKFLVPMERDAMMAYFSSGKTAFILSGSYSIPEFTRLGLPFAVAPFPRTEAGASPLAPMLDYKGFAVTRNSRSPMLARRLAQYLSSPRMQARFCAPLGKLPANEDAWALMPSDSPYLAAVKASYASGIAVPAHPAYGELKNTLWKLLRLWFDGSLDSAELIRSARAILKQ